MTNIFKKMRLKFNAKLFSAITLLSGFIACKCPVSALASDTSTTGTPNFDWLTDPSKGNDTFKGITETVQETGNSLYQLVMAGSIIGLFIAIVFVGLAFFTTNSGSVKEEKKSRLLWVAIGGAIIFGAPSIAGLIYSIAQGF